MDLADFLIFIKNLEFFGNTAYKYLLAVAIFIGLLVVLKVVKVVVVGRFKQLAKKTKNDFDDALIEVFSNVRPPFYFFIALYFGIKALTLPELADQVVKIFFIITVVYEVIQALQQLADYFLGKYLAKVEGGEDKQANQSMVKAAGMVIKVVLWLLGITLVLANLGINVTSIIASLGIGGIAIALALQNILGDIFSSFSIYMDKPFRVGDFIVIGEDKGTVEKIGLKTTRIRTLQGEELVVSNKELTSTRVQNFKKMERRRVIFNLGIVYETKPAKLVAIPGIIKEIINSVKLAEFDRCHFKEYGGFSLDYEVVFYVNSAEFEDYMNIRQQINLEIFKRFVKEKIEFAYPTQTILVSKNK